MTIHLIIGDAHAKPEIKRRDGTILEDGNRRFDWLGKLILDIKPDVIIDIGDFADMPSLSSYDIGKKSYEGRTYNQDIEAAVQARSKITGKLEQYNRSRRKAKKSSYRPRMVALGGNHCEGRIMRAIETDRKLDGLIGVSQLQYRELGWEYIPFLSRIIIDGISYQHYFTSGVMGRPIGGENPALMLINKKHSSSIQGHDHLFSVSTRYSNTGNRIWGFTCGCYLDPEQWESYAGEANEMWHRGILVLRGVKDGDLTDGFEWITIKAIQKEYS